MDLKTLHAYLGQLLAAGVDPAIPVAGLVDSWPCEIHDVAMLTGEYRGDPAPKLPAFAPRRGTVLALVPITEDVAELLNPREASGVVTHTDTELPVEPPYQG